VKEFWLWIPPKAKKVFTDKHWTDFTLNWLPLWGFVRLTWESVSKFDVYDKENKLIHSHKLLEVLNKKEDIYSKEWITLNNDEKQKILDILNEEIWEWSFLTKTYFQKSIIILAWVFMNFIFAIAIFSMLFMIWVKPIWINTKFPTNLELKMIPTMEQSIKIWLLEQKPWIILDPIEWSVASKAW